MDRVLESLRRPFARVRFKISRSGPNRVLVFVPVVASPKRRILWVGGRPARRRLEELGVVRASVLTTVLNSGRVFRVVETVSGRVPMESVVCEKPRNTFASRWNFSIVRIGLEETFLRGTSQRTNRYCGWGGQVRASRAGGERARAPRRAGRGHVLGAETLRFATTRAWRFAEFSIWVLTHSSRDWRRGFV